MAPPLVFSFDQHYRAIIAVWDVLQGGVPGAKALQPTVDFQDSLEFGVGVVQLGAKLAGVRSATVPPAHAFPLADGVPLQLRIAPAAHPARRRTGVRASGTHLDATAPVCEGALALRALRSYSPAVARQVADLSQLALRQESLLR